MNNITKPVPVIKPLRLTLLAAAAVIAVMLTAGCAGAKAPADIAVTPDIDRIAETEREDARESFDLRYAVNIRSLEGLISYADRVYKSEPEINSDGLYTWRHHGGTPELNVKLTAQTSGDELLKIEITSNPFIWYTGAEQTPDMLSIAGAAEINAGQAPYGDIEDIFGDGYHVQAFIPGVGEWRSWVVNANGNGGEPDLKVFTIFLPSGSDTAMMVTYR